MQGDALDIVPRFYILPRDFDEFRSDLERCPSRLYIQKVRSGQVTLSN
jgi:tubulin polyglutamylase TTLL4